LSKKTLDRIAGGGNDFTVQVKANQPRLCRELRQTEQTVPYTGTHIMEEDKNGIKTTRQLYRYPFTSGLDKWKTVATLLVVHKTTIADQVLTHYKRYYISNNDTFKAQDFNEGIREHWHIENYAHRPKDMCFNQDKNQTAIHNNAVNRAIFNTMALNNLTHRYREDKPKEVKINQILFRGKYKEFLNKHRI
jgi:predicted transposase YbfD/YdcC